ncbi:MAG: hypothetical protein IKV97_05230, partial [Clostridia bacterium]|nr:hypothetical protein [Clostridia bacterium]
MLLNAKKLLSKLLITAAVLTVAAVPAFAEEQENFAAESVSVETDAAIEEADETIGEEVMELSAAVYYISTAEELNNVRNDLSGTYYLQKDIDISDYENWTPIGNTNTAFSGYFDGQGHTISGLTISGDIDYVGLFGVVSGKITNLAVDGNVATSKNYAGILAGQLHYDSGRITNCYTTGSVEANQYVGGLVGHVNNYSPTI